MDSRKIYIPFCLILLLFVPLILPKAANGAFDLINSSAHSNATAVSYITSSNIPVGININPASAGKIESLILSTSLTQRFSLKELQSFQLNIAFPLKDFTVGFSGGGFGSGKYEERYGGISLAYPILKNLHVGVGLKQMQLNIENYDSEKLITGNIGLLYDYYSTKVALVVNNIATASSTYSNLTDTRYLFAIKHSIAGKVQLHAELIIDEYSQGQPAFGLEYQINKFLVLASGYSNSTKRLHLGFSLNWNRFDVLMAQDYHSELGWSRAQGFVSRFKKP